jgi:hypothetical protein
MQIKKLKVRPQKSTRALPLPIFSSSYLSPSLRVPFHGSIHSFFFFSSTAIDPPVVLCGPQLASMLGCWAATKDVKSIGPCREHAQALFECMRTAVRFSRLYFRFAAGNLIKVIRLQSIAHEAQTTQTGNKLSSGATREDP